MPERIISRLEILTLANLKRTVLFEAPYHFEAPNWTVDGQWLIFNSNGLIYKILVGGGAPARIDSGFANRCNNDHVLSPDGKEIAVSHHDTDNLSKIFILPLSGGTPRKITPKGPSYLHGWSPDGATLAYCAERNGQYDIYTISVQGGEEKQLTNVTGLDDGPEYAPDGNFIYFNSERTGLMQIWRMKPDGSHQEQLTFDEANNWFAHVAPNGKHFIFLTYDKRVSGHPANKDVQLRIMPYNGGKAETVATLFGGQGTINVNSWSPDSKQVAFVSYELV
jgi:TolB protein